MFSSSWTTTSLQLWPGTTTTSAQYHFPGVLQEWKKRKPSLTVNFVNSPRVTYRAFGVITVTSTEGKNSSSAKIVPFIQALSKYCAKQINWNHKGFFSTWKDFWGLWELAVANRNMATADQGKEHKKCHARSQQHPCNPFSSLLQQPVPSAADESTISSCSRFYLLEEMVQVVLFPQPRQLEGYPYPQVWKFSLPK